MVGDEYSNIHDMEIREEADGEFIYGARNAAAEGIKFSAETGDIVLHLPFPEASGLKLTQFSPLQSRLHRMVISFCQTGMQATTSSSLIGPEST